MRTNASRLYLIIHCCSHPAIQDQMLTSYQPRKPLTTGSSFLMSWSTSAQRKILAHGYPPTLSLVSSRVAIKASLLFFSLPFPIPFISFPVRDVAVQGTAPSIDMMCIYCLNKPFHYLISFFSFCIRLASRLDAEPIPWRHNLPSNISFVEHITRITLSSSSISYKYIYQETKKHFSCPR